ncbi:MAG: hypothetical protein FWC80_00120 [Firmicutes bacterium]|nr:hypothetical protein [Bacillota bacterium]
MNSILTAQSFWKEWDADAPLATTVIKETTDEFNKVKEVYFSGTKKNDGVVRIFGRLTMRKTAVKPPCIVIIGEPHNHIGVPEIELAMDSGYAVFEFDYGGEHPTEARYTLYPESLSYCNYFRDPNLMKSITPNPFDSLWYEWTAVVRRAVKQAASFAEVDTKKIALLGMGDGAVNVWRVCALEPRLRGGAILLGTEQSPPENNTDNDSLRYLAALSPKNYLTFLERSVFVEIASNDTNGYFDTMSGFFNFLPQANNSLLSVTERSEHMVGLKQRPNLGLWFKTIFSEKQPLIYRPTLKAVQSENKLYYELKTNNPNLKIESVEVFYSYGELEPGYRNWTTLPAEFIGDGEYIIKAPIFDINAPINCFATIKFENSYCLSTRLVKKIPSKLGITNAEKIGHTRLLYDNSMGTDCFSAGTNGIFMNEDSLKMAVGPHNIEGVTSLSGILITNKPCDKSYQAFAESLLQLELWSSSPSTIKITAIARFDGGDTESFSVDFPISGGKIWSKATLNANEFKTKDGTYHLESFENVVQLQIISSKDNPVVVSSMLWI